MSIPSVRVLNSAGFNVSIHVLLIILSPSMSTTAEAPAPDPEAPSPNLPTYSSSSPAGYVLEINAGKAAEHGIEAGVPVRFANVSNPDGPACP